MIKILIRDGRTCPIFVCDICGDMISDVNEGAAIFSCSGNENEKTAVMHAHKSACHEKAEAQFSNDGWDELARHIYLLGLNTGLTAEEYAKLEELHKKFGGFL